MQIRHSESSGIEISAPEHQLQQIARALVRGRDFRLRAERDFDPAPYDEVLEALEITPRSGPVRVTVVGKSVVVTGAAEDLERLASFFASAQADEHAHFEWFEGNAFVHRESTPLVIAAATSGG